jgi:hypothetical protein
MPFCVIRAFSVVEIPTTKTCSQHGGFTVMATLRPSNASSWKSHSPPTSPLAPRFAGPAPVTRVRSSREDCLARISRYDPGDARSQWRVFLMRLKVREGDALLYIGPGSVWGAYMRTLAERHEKGY